jgi:hypothetical protein
MACAATMGAFAGEARVRSIRAAVVGVPDESPGEVVLFCGKGRQRADVDMASGKRDAFARCESVFARCESVFAAIAGRLYRLGDKPG